MIHGLLVILERHHCHYHHHHHLKGWRFVWGCLGLVCFLCALGVRGCVLDLLRCRLGVGGAGRGGVGRGSVGALGLGLAVRARVVG